VIDRLVSAAIEEFEEKSFNGATTAAIARRAGVAEALLFNHFGSKAQLFQDTIFKPLEQHFDGFQPSIPVEGAGPEEMREGSREYIAALQDFVSEHRGMFLSLVFAQTYKPRGIDGLAEIKGLHDYFARMAGLAAANLDGEPRINPRYIARISFATIMACVLFRDWLFPDESDDPDIVRTAISDFVMDGLGANATEP
jgi:AcrR family transcriptional regulator